MKGDIFHEELPNGTIRTSTVSSVFPHAQVSCAVLHSDGQSCNYGEEPVNDVPKHQTVPNDYWVAQPDGSRKLITMTAIGKKVNANDQILREILEEVITKSHRQWRSIPETTFLVLRAIEDYQSGN